MLHISDLVAVADDLPFQRGGVIAVFAEAAVMQHAVEHLPGQIQPAPLAVALDLREHAHAVDIVAKTAAHAFVQHIFAAVGKRRVADVVRQRDRFDEIAVQTQRTADGLGDLVDLQRVRETGAVMVVSR